MKHLVYTNASNEVIGYNYTNSLVNCYICVSSLVYMSMNNSDYNLVSVIVYYCNLVSVNNYMNNFRCMKHLGRMNMRSFMINFDYMMLSVNNYNYMNG